MGGSSKRQQRYRQRLKSGTVIVQIEITPDDIDAMNDAGLIDWNCTDKSRLSMAVRQAFNNWRSENEHR